MSNFLSDTLVAADNTFLEQHNFGQPDQWNVGGGFSIKFISNRLYATGNTTYYYNSETPPSPDYVVTAVLHVIDGAACSVRITGRHLATTWYEFGYDTATGKWTLAKLVSGGGPTNIGTPLTASLTNGTDYTIALEMTGTSIAGKVNGVTVVSGTDSAISAANACGMIFWTAASSTTGMQISGPYTGGAGAALTAGAVVQTGSTATTISFTAAAATGGSSPYTYQWYRSITSGFTPGGGNILSGQTSLTLADSSGLSANTVYYYKLVSTDNAAATATSTQISAQLSLPPTSVYFLGDSITAGLHSTTPPGDTVAVRLTEFHKLRQYTQIDGGVSNTTTADWLSGSTNLGNATVACNAAVPPVNLVHIMLGTNDCSSASPISAATYKSNLQNTIAALLANVSSLQYVVVSYPMSFTPGITSGWDTTALALEKTYQPQIDSLANGTTVFVGDRYSYDFFQITPGQLYSDGIHPSTTGTDSLATLWCVGIDRVLNPAAGGLLTAPGMTGGIRG